MYKNLENFIDWLKEVSKAEVDEVYVDETLKELARQNCDTGCAAYELSKFETKSGRPETYSYSVEYEEKNGDIDIIYEF